jgi:hypothetical protein
MERFTISLDAKLAWSRSRFTEDAPEGNYIPGSAQMVASLGATVTEFGPGFG